MISRMALTPGGGRSPSTPSPTPSPDRNGTILNYALYALLGVLVVRDTNIIYAGVAAGFVASLLDAIVVSAASLMMQPTPPPEALWIGFARNLFTGTVFAGLSGIVYVLVQRWSGGRRRRR